MIPTPAQADIYRAPVKIHESRVAVTLGPQMWEAAFEDLFNASLTPLNWWYTQFGAVSPLVDAGALTLQTFGGPPRQMVVGRKHAFPERSDLAFKVTIRATFPLVDSTAQTGFSPDPIYPCVLTVGGIDQLFGVEHEPLRIIYQGSANVAGANVGKIWVGGAGTSFIEYVNDYAEHEYVVEWDPDAPGGAGAEKLTVKRDGAIIAEASHPYYAPQPCYIALGLIQPTRSTAQTGTPTVPVTIGLVGSVRVEENGNGYETFVPPAWTTPDLGNTIETAPDGQIFTQDGTPWVILPRDAVTWEAEGGKSAMPDGASIHLDAADPDSPLLTPNRFVGMRWEGRAITIDAREGMEGATPADPPVYAPWLRQFAGIIKGPIQTKGDQVHFTAGDRPMTRLNTYISRAYTSLTGDGNQQGQIEGVNVGYLLGAVFEDLVDVSDTVAGGTLGDTETQIFAPEVAPLSLSSGAQSLQAVITEWADRLALTIYRRYTVSGSGRYGKLYVHLWDFGTGIAEYVFNGRGSTRGPEDVLAVELKEGGEGTGQVIYRQQTPVYGNENLSLQWLPLVGTFPSASYPVTDRGVSDSAAYLASISLSVILGFPDENGVDQFGGLAKFRYMVENSLRRQITVTLAGGSYIEPGDEIGVEDPAWTGLTSDESFMVLNWRKSYSRENGLETTFTATTSDWVNALLRAL